MGKNRPLPRSAYVRGPTLGADGRMGGSWIRPRSTDPNVLVVHSLDVWDASMGTLYGGTLYAGPNARGASPPRVIIGDAANGLQVYDDDGILCASISWRNGSGRFGRLGSPGITWANGNMYIDGDAIVDGTVRASKLIVGPLGRVILDDDEIRIGAYNDDGEFTGYLATLNYVGGLYGDISTWEADAVTGWIMSRSQEENLYGYIGLGGGALLISSIDSPYSSAPLGKLVFESWRRNPADVDEVVRTGLIYLTVKTGGLALSSPTADTLTSFAVDGSTWNQYELGLLSPTSSARGTLRAYGEEVEVNANGAQSLSLNLQVGEHTYSAVLSENEFAIDRAVQFVPATGTPTTLKAGMAWFDDGTKTFKMYDGTTTHTVDWT